MPISACINESASIPKKLGGLGISSVKHLAQKMDLLKRHSLRSSARADIQEIWSSSSSHHVQTDELLIANRSIESAIKSLKSEQQKAATCHLFGLDMQGVLSQCVTETVEARNIEIWSEAINTALSIIFNFARKALL